MRLTPRKLTARAGRGATAIPFAIGSLTALAACVTLAACNSSRLLDVSTPNNVPVGIISDPANAALAVNSAITDFECAYGSAVLVEGIISDELGDAQLGAAGWPY